MTADERASELPDLTPKQQAFVTGILEGKTASDAYRKAYNCENMLQSTIWTEAAKLKTDPKVAKWLEAARKAAFGSAVLTREAHLAELERLRELAAESKQYSAAITAENLRGKVAGHYVERIADVTDAQDPEHTLRQIAAVSPDLAKSIAAQHNIPWQLGEEPESRAIN